MKTVLPVPIMELGRCLHVRLYGFWRTLTWHCDSVLFLLSRRDKGLIDGLRERSVMMVSLNDNYSKDSANYEWVNEKHSISESEFKLWITLAGCFSIDKDDFSPLFPEKKVREIFKSADKKKLQGMLISILAELRKFDPENMKKLFDSPNFPEGI